MKRFFQIFIGIIFCCPISVFSDVVINEINYDPVDIGNESGQFREFIELYNPDTTSVDLSGYQFTDGITYTFPNGTILAANQYLVVVRMTSHRMWRNVPYQVLGPYEGSLGNGGERVRLNRPGGALVEEIRYDDDLPWSPGADGYGPTLERISPTLPTNDHHSWRTSVVDEGTPGRANSVTGTIPRPLITGMDTIPKNPQSTDEVRVQIGIDFPRDAVEAYLRYESSKSSSTSSSILIRANETWRYRKGTSSPSPSLEWTQLSYNDTTWETGQGGFGYGDIDTVNTILNDMRSSYSTFYIRKKFTVEDLSSLGAVSLNIYYDDGFICYINGVEVARAVAPSSYTNTSTADGSHEGDVEEAFEISPSALRSGENVIALVGFNTSLGGSSDFVLSPSLTATTFSGGAGGSNRIPMNFVAETATSATFEGRIPPLPTQTLVRYNLELLLQDGSTLLLPHAGERAPFGTYFVYDDEIPTILPMMWIFEDRLSSLSGTAKQYTAGVFLMPGDDGVQVFDGLRFERSENGNKMKFNKGHEFRADRTINIIPENPPFGGTAGSSGPFREHLSFWFYPRMGIYAPRADWFRVIENPGESREEHTQRVIVQQINEKFLEMNGLDADGDLYKLEWNTGLIKHTNIDEGNGTITELQQALTRNSGARLKQEIEDRMHVDYFIDFSVASVLSSNWDGFFNNNWMFLPREEGQENKWYIIPWDTDKLWGFTDRNPLFWEMPTDYPLNGVAAQEGRPPGPITGPFHQVPEFHEEYKKRLRLQLNKEYVPNDAPIHRHIDEDEALLYEDLDMLEGYLSTTFNRRRNQINDSYSIIRDFLRLRTQYLDQQLPPAPVSVENWALY